MNVEIILWTMTGIGVGGVVALALAFGFVKARRSLDRRRMEWDRAQEEKE